MPGSLGYLVVILYYFLPVVFVFALLLGAFCTYKNKSRTARLYFCLSGIVGVLFVLTLLFGSYLIDWEDKRARHKSLYMAAQIQIRKFEMGLQAYYLDNRHYPSTKQGLGELTKRYLKKDTLPLDPWGQFYHYRYDDSNSYTISSNGPDKTLGTPDDITTKPR